MKRYVLGLLVAVFVLGLLSVNVSAEQRLGYVDLSRLFDGYEKTKEYDKALTAKEDAYEKERDRKVDEIKRLQDKLSILSEKEREKKQEKVDDKIRALQDFDQERQTDLRKERDERIKEILQDIDKAVRTFAENEGYTLIFNDRVLVYQSKQLDVTDKVAQILKNNHSKR